MFVQYLIFLIHLPDLLKFKQTLGIDFLCGLVQVYKRRIFLYNGIFRREVLRGCFSRKLPDLISSMALVSVEISSGAVHVVHLPWNIVRKYNSSCKYMPRPVFEEIKKQTWLPHLFLRK